MRLLEFPHSHFCEKARWALDYKGLTFQPVAILPPPAFSSSFFATSLHNILEAQQTD